MLSRHVDEVSILNQNRSRKLDIAQPDERGPARNGGAFCCVERDLDLNCAHKLENRAHGYRLKPIRWFFLCLLIFLYRRQGLPMRILNQ